MCVGPARAGACVHHQRHSDVNRRVGRTLGALVRLVWSWLSSGLAALFRSGRDNVADWRRDETGEMQTVRTYEFLLVPWSVDMDNQLELGLAEESGT